jgi:hypothetical protein
MAEDAAQAFHAGRGYPHLKKTFGEVVVPVVN